MLQQTKCGCRVSYTSIPSFVAVKTSKTTWINGLPRQIQKKSQKQTLASAHLETQISKDLSRLSKKINKGKETPSAC
nr:ORF2 [Anelloviridae sp.]